MNEIGTFASGRGADGSGGQALAFQSPRVSDGTPGADEEDDSLPGKMISRR